VYLFADRAPCKARLRADIDKGCLEVWSKVNFEDGERLEVWCLGEGRGLPTGLYPIRLKASSPPLICFRLTFNAACPNLSSSLSVMGRLSPSPLLLRSTLETMV